MVNEESFTERLQRIQSEIKLGMNCDVLLDEHESKGYYFQVTCWRPDAITGEMGRGFGGKAYVEPEQSDDQIVGAIFGLYKGYWEHEARETFLWQERRIYGPHIKITALHEVARRVDIPSARHVGDVPANDRVQRPEIDGPGSCPTCRGTGRIATGPWGRQPPKITCPHCNGTGWHGGIQPIEISRG